MGTKRYFVYIATNKNDTVLYTGITNNIQRRMYEHSHKAHLGFTAKYNVNKLLWYEVFSSPTEAIVAEKKIKGWRREKKLKLIEDFNPDFKNLLRDSSTDVSE
ncbi:MAG: GIY-YIG nuclease family protein [bacterium]|nr:GIY-YIG nuclease family protein [bacterium]